MSRVDGPSDGSGVGRRDRLAGNSGWGYVAARSDLRSGGIGDPLGRGRCCVRGGTGAENEIKSNRMGAHQPRLLGIMRNVAGRAKVSRKGGPEDTHLLCLLTKASAL